MRNINARNRCELFKKIATDVWEDVQFIHRADIEASEIGITKSIIATIKHHRNYRPFTTGVKLLVQPGHQESQYGSDLEIFIETSPNQYVMIALQAKVLKKNGRYLTFNDGANNEGQWDKLRRLQDLTQCIPYLLLYNGKQDYEHIGQDQCGKNFTEDQFGCSLVTLDKFEHYASLPRRNPTFEEIHPQDAQPWRILTCCNNFDESTTYTYEQIEFARNFRRKKNKGALNFEHESKLAYTKDIKWIPHVSLIIQNYPKQKSK